MVAKNCAIAKENCRKKVSVTYFICYKFKFVAKKLNFNFLRQKLCFCKKNSVTNFICCEFKFIAKQLNFSFFATKIELLQKKFNLEFLCCELKFVTKKLNFNILGQQMCCCKKCNFDMNSYEMQIHTYCNNDSCHNRFIKFCSIFAAK